MEAVISGYEKYHSKLLTQSIINDKLIKRKEMETMKYNLNGREVNIDSFEYSISLDGQPVIESGEFSDGLDYLTAQELWDFQSEYGIPEEAYDIIQNENEALTLSERNS